MLEALERFVHWNIHFNQIVRTLDRFVLGFEWFYIVFVFQALYIEPKKIRPDF